MGNICATLFCDNKLVSQTRKVEGIEVLLTKSFDTFICKHTNSGQSLVNQEASSSIACALAFF